MERVYFSINESAAKTAHSMMSFSDYEEGSKTAGYKAKVDKAYELGEKVIQARPSGLQFFPQFSSFANVLQSVCWQKHCSLSVLIRYLSCQSFH